MFETWHNRGLADALGSVREEIRHLKAREADLRRAILSAPRPEAEEGVEYTLQIKRSLSHRLNRNALPPEILHNPKYWTTRETVTVLTPATGGSKQPTETEFDVVEPI